MSKKIGDVEMSIDLREIQALAVRLLDEEILVDGHTIRHESNSEKTVVEISLDDYCRLLLTISCYLDGLKYEDMYDHLQNRDLLK